mmetsp:Transcript_98521/g.195425  ORF Transcript_98521/g.195425 Transcript_98521/m.195425 type:complete len:270 (+) Transcript_98521:196-1005(+)
MHWHRQHHQNKFANHIKGRQRASRCWEPQSPVASANCNDSRSLSARHCADIGKSRSAISWSTNVNDPSWPALASPLNNQSFFGDLICMPLQPLPWSVCFSPNTTYMARRTSEPRSIIEQSSEAPGMSGKWPSSHRPKVVDPSREVRVPLRTIVRGNSLAATGDATARCTLSATSSNNPTCAASRIATSPSSSGSQSRARAHASTQRRLPGPLPGLAVLPAELPASTRVFSLQCGSNSSTEPRRNACVKRAICPGGSAAHASRPGTDSSP